MTRRLAPETRALRLVERMQAAGVERPGNWRGPRKHRRGGRDGFTTD